MRKIGTTSAGAVVVEMTDSEFSHCEKALGTPATVKRMTHDELVPYVRERLKKLNPKSKVAADHSIEAMFQFQGGISAAERGRILASLRKEGFPNIGD